MKPKQKILESSFALFRKKGFQATGIAEILDKAGAYKKTLYDHFKSKDDIGFEYLNYLSEQQRIVMLKVLGKSNSMSDFIEKWVNFIVRNQRNTSRKDCPIALFLVKFRIWDSSTRIEIKLFIMYWKLWKPAF